MLNELLLSAFAPFTVALALLFGLLALELVLMLVGVSLLGDSADADVPMADGVDADLDVGEFDLDGVDLDGVDLDSDLDAAELNTGTGADASGGLLSWLGLGRTPALVWLASLLMAFGLTGIVAQMAVSTLVGAYLPAILIAIPAGLVAVWFARGFGAVFARLLPKNETSALSERHLGKRVGVVTQGNAARGRPAEVRVTDRYGNTHYLRAEPLKDEAVIPQGSEVVVARARLDGRYFIVALTN